MALAIFFCAAVGSLSLVSFLSPPRLADAAISNANVQAVPSRTVTKLAAAVIVGLRMASSPFVGVPAKAGGGATTGKCPRVSSPQRWEASSASYWHMAKTGPAAFIFLFWVGRSRRSDQI